MHAIVADAIAKLANRAGYEILPKWRAKSYQHAELIQRLLSSRNIDIVIDVGGNIGGFAKWMRLNCGYRGRIASLEPVAVLYAQLERAAAGDAAWTTHRLALGPEVGSLPINVTRDPSATSFLTPVETLPDGFSKLPLEVERIEEVEVHRLDHFLETVGEAARNIFLKLDTQGYDLEVLKGAGDALRKVAVLQSEVSLLPLYYGMPDWLESMAELRRIGYFSAGMFPVTRDDLDRVVEYDAVMVR